MSVVLTRTPDPYALTRSGRMSYGFSGSGRYASRGINALGVLLLASPVVSGTSLTLNWGGQPHTISFVDNPQANTEFPTGDGSRTYAATLLSLFRSYYPFRENFVLDLNEPTQLPGITFLARKPGKAYDITVSLPVGTPFGFGNTRFGGEPLLRVRYSVYAELWVQKPGTPGIDRDTDFARAFAVPVETDEDGQAEFDAGPILHSLLSADWPHWNTTVPVTGENSQCRYFLSFGEAYGDPFVIGRLSDDAINRAYLGGADYLHRAGGGYRFLGYRTTVAAADAALRSGGLLRYVRTDEPQYLTFLNSRTDSAVSLLVTRTFDNDDSDNQADVPTTVALGVDSKLTYCVGASQLGLLSGLPTGRSLKQYTVQLVDDDGNALSREYRYVLNYDYQPYTRYFVYLSSLGVPESLATFGKGSQELSRFFEQSEKFLSTTYEVSEGQFEDYNLELQQQVEVTTGFRAKASLTEWNDFYRSPVRFYLTDGKAIPIGITSKSIQQAKDGDTLFAHKFSFVYLFRDEFYTDDPYGAVNVPLPQSFVPAGNVTVQQQTIVNSVDDTIPDAVRNLTALDIQKFQTVASRPNPETLGFLTQQAGSALFRRTDQKLDYHNDLTNQPTTRDQAGLSDVPTRAELMKTIFDNLDFSVDIKTWTTTLEPK